MASNRATKSGIALEAQQKVASKWNSEHAQEALAWIGKVIGEPIHTDGSMKDVHEKLKDGVILARLANWVKPGSIPESKFCKPPALAFKQMELIGRFLEVIDVANGGYVRKPDLFQTVDLYECCNMVQVVLTFQSLGRCLLTAGREGFGKAESKGQTHEWTDEQLGAGKNIIGLQMGSNKGATQAGQNFGKSRGIIHEH